MNWFLTVKRYYEQGYYTKEQVGLFVAGGRITEEEYETITGTPYPSE